MNKYLIRLWMSARPYKKRMALAVLGMLGAAGTEPLFPYILKILIDNGFNQDRTLPIWSVPVVIVGIFLVRGLFTFCTQYYMAWVANKLLSDMRHQMFSRMLHIPIHLYQEASSAKLINTIMYEVQQVVELIKVSINTLMRDTISVCALMAYLIYYNWQLTMVSLLIIPTMAIVMRVTSRRLRFLNQHQLTLNSELTQVVEEGTRAAQVIRVFGGADYEERRFHVKNEKLRGYAQRVTVVISSITPLTQMTAALAVSLVIVIAMQPGLLPFGGTTVFSPGDFVGYITAMTLLLAPLKRLSDLNGPLQRGLIAAESVFGLMDAPIEEDTGKILSHRAQGHLSFNQVSFCYADNTQPILSEVSFEVAAGETVALVGMSGAGKTTLVNLVPRFYMPTSGFITLDGDVLSDLSLSSVRNQMALVGQSVVLFDDTLAANVAYGDEHPNEKKIEAAIDAAYLREVVEQLPLGIYTMIGDNGMRLSGGQRQRLAIARAIYKDAPILILDEATSALDTESERFVQTALETLMKNRTTLVVAHRLSTIERADKIVVLSEGKVSEMGTHSDLLKAGGLYAHLYQLQFRDVSR